MILANFGDENMLVGQVWKGQSGPMGDLRQFTSLPFTSLQFAPLTAGRLQGRDKKQIQTIKNRYSAVPGTS